jgi:hypothetical protein
MGKICMHQHRRIALGTISTLHRQPQQVLYASRITTALLVTHDGQREHPGIPFEHLGRAVLGSIVQNKQLVLSREARENLANLPQ